ncbi:MAG: hypothetical protein WCS54_05295 [Fibrobacteraceae bacterium]
MIALLLLLAPLVDIEFITVLFCVGQLLVPDAFENNFSDAARGAQLGADKSGPLRGAASFVIIVVVIIIVIVAGIEVRQEKQAPYGDESDFAPEKGRSCVAERLPFYRLLIDEVLVNLYAVRIDRRDYNRRLLRRVDCNGTSLARRLLYGHINMSGLIHIEYRIRLCLREDDGESSQSQNEK